MKRLDFERICGLAEMGRRQVVENTRMKYTGEVIGCRDGYFEVEAFGHRAEWPRLHCVTTDKPKNYLGPPSNV